MAQVRFYRDAHPDVQLDLPPRRGLPAERSRRWPDPGAHDPHDERRCDLAALPPAQEHFLVSRALALRVPRHLQRAVPTQSLLRTENTFMDNANSKLPVKAVTRDFNFFYGNFHALKNINLPVVEKHVTALIGPSGCGKSTLLRSFNRMHDLYPGNRYQGEIVLNPDNTNILDTRVDPIEVRMRVGMVFQKPNPFPKSIYEN